MYEDWPPYTFHIPGSKWRFILVHMKLISMWLLTLATEVYRYMIWYMFVFFVRSNIIIYEGEDQCWRLEYTLEKVKLWLTYPLYVYVHILHVVSKTQSRSLEHWQRSWHWVVDPQIQGIYQCDDSVMLHSTGIQYIDNI